MKSSRSSQSVPGAGYRLSISKIKAYVKSSRVPARNDVYMGTDKLSVYKVVSCVAGRVLCFFASSGTFRFFCCKFLETFSLCGSRSWEPTRYFLLKSGTF